MVGRNTKTIRSLPNLCKGPFLEKKVSALQMKQIEGINIHGLAKVLVS